MRHQVPQLQGIWYSPWSNCLSVFLSILGHRYHGQCHPYPHYSQVRQFFATKSNNVRLIKSIYKPEFVSILLPNLTNWSDFNCNVFTSKSLCNLDQTHKNPTYLLWFNQRYNHLWICGWKELQMRFQTLFRFDKLSVRPDQINAIFNYIFPEKTSI